MRLTKSPDSGCRAHLIQRDLIIVQKCEGQVLEMKLSIMIPCFNEEGAIADVISQTLQTKFPCETEVIVVDDGSTDGSRAVIDGYHKVTIITHTANKGKGAAIKTGIHNASGDLFAIQDADMEYPPQFLPKLIDPILCGKADVVIGSRFLGKIEGMSWSHTFANKLLSRIASLLTGQAITDVMTGHKAFRTSLLKNMPLQSHQFEVEVELIMRAAKAGARITEIPIDYAHRKTGSAKIEWRHAITSLILLLKLGIWHH